MAVRPFVFTGLALASAGLLVAGSAAVAPPLTPRDAQVAADVQNAVSAGTLIDAFIAGGSLQAAIVGAADCAEPDCEDKPVAQGFIDGGSLQAAIVALAGPDNDVANAFIEGGSLQAAIVALAGPDNDVANAFIEGGSLQAAIVHLAGCTSADCEENPEVNGFIQGGTLQAGVVAAADCTTGDCSADADNPVAGGFISGGTLEAGLVAVRENTAAAAVTTTGTQTLAKTGTPQTNNGTAGFGGTQKIVEDIKSNSLVFGGAPKVASDPAPTGAASNPAPVITPPVKKAAAAVEEKGEEDEGLVRDSLSFKPEPIIPLGNSSGRGAGGPSLLEAVAGAFGGFGGGGSEDDDNNAGGNDAGGQDSGE